MKRMMTPMLDFKATVQKDIETVLFNTTEAAQLRMVNDKEIPIIIDYERLQELKAKAQYAAGISTAELLIFVQRKDLGYRPGVGGIITIGEDIYRVAGVSGDVILELILEANG